MNLCSENHDEICFDGHRCPMCVMRDDMQVTLDNRDKTISYLQSDVKDLEEEVEDLTATHKEGGK